MTWRDDSKALLRIQDLKTWFPIKKGFLRTVIGHVKAVDGIDLAIPRGRTVGLVGESGCGKTTLGRTVLRLIEATSGRLFYRMNDTEVDLSALKAEELFQFRPHMQIIFQDPFSSLDPRMSVGDIVGEYLKIHKRPNRQEKTVALLESVGLNSQYFYRYPHEFSGGQRQRIGIARALSLDPEFIVCDEPVSALDVSIQAQITNLLKKLQREKGLTYLFISHDLRVVEYMSDRVAVMYLGKVVEYCDTRDLYNQPLHPYSEALLSAIPSHQAGTHGRIVLEGDVPSPAHPPAGCRFHPRCRYAEQICRTESPGLANLSKTGAHYVACHLAGRLELKGCRSQG